MRHWIEWVAAAMVLLLLGGLFMVQVFSRKDDSQDKTPAPGTTPSAGTGLNEEAEPPPAPAPHDGFASDRPGGDRISFDGRRAMRYLNAICSIGPRISGTDGMKRQQELLEKLFKELGAEVRYQRFTARQRSVRKDTEMANLIASWHPERTRRCILCSHYDTRPIADQEDDPRRWRDPFISANDGGSGVALLMEFAHHMKDLPTDVGVDFVFFDGEEYVWEHEGDEYFFGSKHFGQQYRRNPGRTAYVGAILLDMVGGKDAHFPVERNSWRFQPRLVETIWNIAREQHISSFQSERFSRYEIEDDHLPLNRSGIPAIDIIDFDYKHWHRLSDVPSNCSGESLEQVAQVLAIWLQRVK